MLSLSLYVAIVAAFAVPLVTSSNVWAGKEFESLVTFGDSYTDEQRISYFASNNGTAPPVGWIEPVVGFSSNILSPLSSCMKSILRMHENIAPILN